MSSRQKPDQAWPPWSKGQEVHNSHLDSGTKTLQIFEMFKILKLWLDLMRFAFTEQCNNLHLS